MVAKEIKWYVLVTSATVLMGVILFVAKVLMRGLHPLIIIPFQFVGSMIFLFVLITNRGINMKIDLKTLLFLFLIGGLIATGFTFYYIALSIADVSRVVPLQNIGHIIVPTVLAIVFLKEKITVRECCALICAILSMIVMSV